MFILVYFLCVFILWISCFCCFKNKICLIYVRIIVMFCKINIYIRYIWKYGGFVIVFLLIFDNIIDCLMWD